ncbi:hypothetical protein Taro_033925 [Colocasia esculenta]|uniref:Myb-like domain-containing protein n=1 Tax=Colocasia esculenta TaxID=4460 RepID=A0A843WAD6_COLES|nr:hypothetical protein [Colocasia esculenta]
MQQGGSQYGVPLPEMNSFGGSSGTGSRAQVLGIPTQEQQQPPLAEAASPISSRPPQHSANFDELAPTVPGGFPDEDALAAAGEEAERGAVPGNRWPPQETVALLKIRSDMDAAFRDATLKGPLWEEVSRKLAEMGYKRSAKKCKEKFENVHKYYKRTKDGRTGRQDGKTYRFFTQLEALHSGGGGNATTVAAASTIPAPAPIAASPLQASIGMLGSSGSRLQPTPLNSNPPQIGATTRVAPDPMGGTSAGLAGPPLGVSFSSDTASSSASESEGEDTEEGLPGESRKRKRRSGDGGSRKMMAFFEGLMKQVMERQEAMQQRFLETIEKREQDRMIREEAWKRQEMARLNREHEMMAQERAISATRDAAIIAFLQKMTGQTVPVPSTAPSVTPPPPAPQPASKQPLPSAAPVSAAPPQHPPAQHPPAQQQTKQHIQHQGTEIVCAQASPVDVGPVAEAPEVVGASGTGATDPSSSRWPKAEVHALIDLRSGLDSRYQEAGPKGPLWEEIAGEMQRIGYNRSAKRCKEKWENINKYFKKVKEGNKKRPEDSKTCPYFHQLDALYRKKVFVAGSSQTREQELDANPNPTPNSQDRPAAGPFLLRAPPQQAATETEGKDDGSSSNGNRNGGNPEGNGGSSSLQMQTSNGGFAASFLHEQPGSVAAKKVRKLQPEDIVKGLMDQQQQQHHHQKQQQHSVMEAYKSLEEPDSDNMDQEDDEDDDEDDEASKMAYKIQYQQRPGVNGGSNGGGNQTTSTAAAAAVAAAAAAGSFMAMVQ